MFWFVLLVFATSAFFCRKGRYRWFYILAKTYRRDFRGAWGFVRLNIQLWIWQFQKQTVPSVFSSLVKKHPNKTAFYFEDEAWTFTKVDEFSNKVARFFMQEGFKEGDKVALLLENRPEFPSIWLGLSKIGVVTALINTNLASDPLLHSITVSHCRAVIFGSNHAKSIKGIFQNLSSYAMYQLEENGEEVGELVPDAKDFKKELKRVSGDEVVCNCKISFKNPLVYIYTSGTTGLPKAAVITHVRFMFMSMAVHCLGRFCKDDVIYNPLPLYHTAGGMLGIGQTFLMGLTLVIRRKFSASNYWKDCAQYNCSVGQYVGEICRYVLAATPTPVKHSVRAVFGNGLRPQIWTQFVEKFGIQDVFEVYGATEGISNLINIDNTVGCVGFVPRYLRWIYPVTLIKCNEATGEPLRDEAGHCIPCQVNESGLVIGKINSKKSVFEFKGYSDKDATEKKILQNVFKDKDMYFNSGDILYGDEFGNFFFKDRTGDTFRWKGENVSTTEVEAVISNIVQLNDAVVFGVKIPETEGRAGMAAIVDTERSLDLNKLCQGLKSNLPAYAVPVFIRIMESVPLTGTYKLKKVELQAEGFNIETIKENIYFYNAKGSQYVPLTKEIYDNILKGHVNV